MTQPSTMGSLVGKVIGSYRIVGPLGQGGMASVYRAYQEAIDRTVAIKVLPAELLHDPTFLKRFINEARTLAKLQHPNILPLYDFGEANGLPYIMMPLMSGGTLADRIRAGRLSPEQTVEILRPIAEALDYAHSQGLLHRDIKPNNILFDPRGMPVLADFGIAKSLETTSGMTGAGIIGTPDYMSPEQARGETLDPRSDVYALAIVIYHMLTGQTPFRATDAMGILFKHVTEPPPPLRRLRPDLSPAVEAAVLKSLSKSPADRHQSAGDLIRSLAEAAAHPARAAAPPPPTLYQPGTIAVGNGTSPALSPVTGPQAALSAKKKPNLWLIAGGVVIVAGLCIVGAIGLAGVGVFGLSASAATATGQAEVEAATARALLVRNTQEAAFVTQAALDAEATAIAQQAFNWPLVLQEGFDSDERRWPVGAVGGGLASGSRNIAGGVYLWSISASGDVNLRADLDFESGEGDFFVSVDARRNSGPAEADYGPIFRRVSSRSFYYFAVSDANGFAVYVLQGGAWATVLPLTPSDLIQPGAYNRLAVQGEGPRYILYINNTPVAEFEDNRLTSGGFGLSAQLLGGQRAQFEFDNFEIRRP